MLFNINFSLKMNKSPKLWFKKNYFTYSQPTLPSNHPTDEFMSIIQLKKHYQSLIKQELNALMTIQNVQNNQLHQWQNQLQKQVKISLFEVKQVEDPPIKVQKIVVEKSAQQFVSCYDALRLIKMHKSFSRLKQKLMLSRDIGVKKRAASYLSSHSVSQRWFIIWKQQAKEALTDAKITKNKQIALVNRLRSLYFGKIIGCLRFGSKKKELKALMNFNCKKTFLSRMCNLTSIRFVKIRQQKALNQLKKRRALTNLKRYIQNRLRVAQISLKSKLLKNIFCQRKFNIFFTACKQQKFKKQQTQITHEIINKVDMLALITKSSEISQSIDQNSSHHLFAHLKDAKTKSTLNVLLLNLILQNFVDEYSQEFSSNFSEQQRIFLLVELRSLIVSELIVKQQSRFLIKSLSLQLNARRLQANLQFSNISSTILQFNNFREFNACKKQLECMIKQQRQRQFMQLLRLRYQMKQKKAELQRRRVGFSWRGRKYFNNWKQYRLNTQVLKLNQQMASNWHQMYNYRLYFSRWVKAIHLTVQPHEYEVESTNKIQNINQTQRVQPKSPLAQGRSTQVENTQKVTKVKMQLSKIVSAISKSMIASKYSLDSYSKSIELHNTHRFTQIKMKTESAPHIDYEPKAFDQLLDKKQSIEEELDRQIENKLSKLTQKIYKIRLKHCLKFMRQECHYNSCINKVKEVKTHKWINRLVQNYRFVSVTKQKMSDLLVYRQKRALLRFRVNSHQLQNVRNQLQLKQYILNQHLMKSAKNKVGDAINTTSFRVKQQKKLGQLIDNRFVSRSRQFLRKAYELMQLNLKKSALRSLKLKQYWFQLMNNLQRQTQNADSACQMNKQLSQQLQVHQQESNYLADYLHNSSDKVEQSSYNRHSDSPSYVNQPEFSKQSEIQQDQEQPAIQEQAKQQQQQQYYQHKYNQQDQFQQDHYRKEHNQQEHIQQFHDQQLYNIQEVNNFSHVKPYSLNSSINTHYAKLPAITEPATSSNYFKTTQQHNQESLSEEQEWLQQKLDNNSLKKKHDKPQSHHLISNLIQLSKVDEQPLTNKYQPLSLDDTITIDQPLFIQCKRLVLRHSLLKLLSSHRQSQQRAIRKQQQLEIVKYQLHKRDKQLKANAFRLLLDKVNHKKDTDLLAKSWNAWKLITQQKRTLKQYLRLQKIAQEQSVSYFPMTLNQKQMFEYLKKQ